MVVLVAIARTIWGGVLVDIEVDKEQGKDEEHANGNADRNGDPSFVGETVG